VILILSRGVQLKSVANPPDCGAALGPTGEARIRRRDISKLLMHSNIFEPNTHHIAQYAESAWTSGEEKQSQLSTSMF